MNKETSEYTKREADRIMSALKEVPMTSHSFDGRYVEGTWRGKTSADFKYDAMNKRVVFDKAGYLAQAIEIARKKQESNSPSNKKLSCSAAAKSLRREKSKSAARKMRCECSPLPPCKSGLAGIGYIFGPHE